MYIDGLIVESGIEDGVNDNAGVSVRHTITQIFVESSNDHSITTKPNRMEDDSGISALDDMIINANKTTEDNLNHQGCISQDEGMENIVTLMPKRKKIHHNTNSGCLYGNDMCCKVSVIFGVCCIIGCYLIPITLYYVGQARGDPETGLEFSQEKNTSAAKVCAT